MPRKIEHALSVRKVKTAGPGRWCDGGGLYLQVSKTSARSWVFRYRISGRLRELGLGSLSTIGLSEARERARAMRMKRLDQIDPIEERRAARSSNVQLMTFDQAMTSYFAEHEGVSWKNEGQRRSQLLNYASPSIGKIPLATIDTIH